MTSKQKTVVAIFFISLINFCIGIFAGWHSKPVEIQTDLVVLHDTVYIDQPITYSEPTPSFVPITKLASKPKASKRSEYMYAWYEPTNDTTYPNREALVYNQFTKRLNHYNEDGQWEQWNVPMQIVSEPSDFVTLYRWEIGNGFSFTIQQYGDDFTMFTPSKSNINVGRFAYSGDSSYMFFRYPKVGNKVIW